METRLYVGNLSDDVSADALRTRFSTCGTVSDVQLATDRTSGRFRGYAFVTMASPADAKSAMDQLNGVMFDDRPLRVNAAGEERETSRARAANEKQRTKITSQFRERHNMSYELDCVGVLLSIKIFFVDENEKVWRVEATVKGLEGAPDSVVEATASTRALALAEIGRIWLDKVPDTAAKSLDWTAITEALSSVRAL